MINESMRLFDADDWGRRGFAVPYFPPSNAFTNNDDILELVTDVGKQLLNVMNQPDVMSTAPPKLRWLILVHRLVQRYRQVTAQEVVESNELDNRPAHTVPMIKPWLVYPCPCFSVRNKFARRWGGLTFQAMSEMMQHQTNIYPTSIYRSFIRDTRWPLDTIYAKLGTQFFNKDKKWAADPLNTLTDADFSAYNEDAIFISSERIDRRAPLNTTYSDQDLGPLSDGVVATVAMNFMKVWPLSYPDDSVALTPTVLPAFKDGGTVTKDAPGQDAPLPPGTTSEMAGVASKLQTGAAMAGASGTNPAAGTTPTPITPTAPSIQTQV